MTPAGAMLRQRREALGVELAEAAGVLKIKPAFLAALEEGQPERLPGPAYAAGFLRAYGVYLGLDGAEVLRRFKAEAEGLDAKPDLSFPVALGERSMPGRTLLLVALILAFCGYGAWYYLATGTRWRPERVSAVPAALLRPVAAVLPPKTVSPPQPPAPLAGDGAAPAATDRSLSAAAVRSQETMPRAPAVSSGTRTAALADPPPTPTPTPTPTPAATPRLAKTPAANGPERTPGRIVIRATAPSWIEVRDGGSAVLVERVLKPGDSYRVPNRPGLTLWTGNAGGLAITVGGKAVPSLGRSGVVRRNIALEPDVLTAGATAGR